MEKLISIIIPTYNRAHIISETLNSIIAQTYKNWECIIVDDGSSDETEELIQRFIEEDKRFSFFKRPDTLVKGPCSCRNLGFEKSKGKFVKWFDSDDILLKDALQIQYVSFKKDTDVVVSKLQLRDFEKKEIIEESVIFSEELIENYFIGKVTFYVSGPMWRKSFLMGKNLFDENIRNLDDWDFNLRMLYLKPSVVFLDKVIIYYRIHQDSLIHELDKLNLEEIKSEFNARDKHIKILIERGVNTKKLTGFIVFRHKVFLRMALVDNNKIKYYLFLETLKKQIENYNLFSGFKTVIFTSFYLVFNKGYKYLK